MIAPSIAVITSASETVERDMLFKFARNRYTHGEIRLISNRFADIAIIDADIDRAGYPSAQARFQIRDLIRTQAMQRHGGVSSKAIIVPCVAHEPGEDGFEECVRVGIREHQVVRGWGIFNAIELFFMVPTKRIVSVEYANTFDGRYAVKMIAGPS